MLKGIDISHWQRDSYKDAIDRFAEDFVIMRAAWRYWVDPTCDKAYQYAKSKGKKLGVYFFPLTSDGSATKHAEWAVDQVLGYLGEAIIALDWESYSCVEGYNNVNLKGWAIEWLKAFERKSGVKPLIYMNSSCERSDWSDLVENDNGLWIANYGPNDGEFHGRPPISNWPFAAIHQYTSILGGKYDGDAFYGDHIAWSKYAAKR